MITFPRAKERLPATDLAPEDLQAIFENIEDNLAFWRVVNNEAVRSQDDGLPVSLVKISAVSDWLKMSSAPLYLTQGMGGARGLIYRFLNLGLKVIGLPQIRFNQKLREFLGELLLTFHDFNIQAVALKTNVEDLNFRVRTLEAENSDFRQEIETLNKQAEALRAVLDQLAEERGGEKRA